MAILSEMLGLHIEGWTRVPELVWLFAAAQRVNSVVEIGSWKGRSTCALLSGCGGTVVAVDHWQGSEAEREDKHLEAVRKDVHAEFMENVGHFTNLKELRMTSAAAAAQINYADMVFIDGGHEYEDVLKDIMLWKPGAGKILCGHDYDWPSVKRAVDERFGNLASNPVGNIWSVAMDEVFAAEPGHAFLFGGEPKGDFGKLLDEAANDVLTRLGTGWILRRTESALLEPAKVAAEAK